MSVSITVTNNMLDVLDVVVPDVVVGGRWFLRPATSRHVTGKDRG